VADGKWRGFIFGRADWEYVLNCFCFGYRVGYKFIATRAGKCNGNFLGIGADDCYRDVLVEQSAAFGLLITNAEFTSFHGPDPTMVEVGPEHHGVIRFSNSAFWGPCNQIAKIAGTGTVGFSDCTFVQWGRDGDRAAIQATSGTVLVRACDFLQNTPHISLGHPVDRAVIAGNLFQGPVQIVNDSHGNVQIGLSGNPDLPDAQASQNYYLLTNLAVQGKRLLGAVVPLGASITEGYKATDDTYREWPSVLAQRLARAGLKVGVLNEGFSENRLLAAGAGDSAESRFQRDVLDQPGVRWVIFSDDPINDLGSTNPLQMRAN